MRWLRRCIVREIQGQLLHPQPAPAAGELRALRKAQNITLQAATANLHVWPAALSGLVRGLSRDDVLYQSYACWLSEH